MNEPEIREIDEEEREEELSKTTQKGQWKTLIERVKTENKSFKVEGITRGQIAALYRSAKNAGINVKTSYKNGYVVIYPA